MTFREISKKLVVQTLDGTCLGRVDDLVLDESGRSVQSFVVYGESRLFGLLGREPDLVIPVEKVMLFGVDVLLVDTNVPKREKKAAKKPLNWDKWTEPKQK